MSSSPQAAGGEREAGTAEAGSSPSPQSSAISPHPMSTEGKALPSAFPRLGRLRALSSCKWHRTQGEETLHAARRSTGGFLVPRAMGRRGPATRGVLRQGILVPRLYVWTDAPITGQSPALHVASPSPPRVESSLPWLPGQRGGAGWALPAAVCLVSVHPTSADFTDSPLPAPLLEDLWQRSW